MEMDLLRTKLEQKKFFKERFKNERWWRNVPEVPAVRKKEIYSSEYRAWVNMKTRCYNRNCPGYKYYGARGIVVCKRCGSPPTVRAGAGQDHAPQRELHSPVRTG